MATQRSTHSQEHQQKSNNGNRTTEKSVNYTTFKQTESASARSLEDA